MIVASEINILSTYWDTIHESKHLALHAAIYTWAASLIQPGWVLDLGCEYGFGSLLVKETNPALKVLGLDLNFKFLDYSLSLPSLEWTPRLNASGSHLPISSGSLSGVYLVNLLHLVEDPTAIIAETWRTLKPGGAAILSIPMDASNPPKWGTSALTKYLEHELHSNFSHVNVLTKISGQLPSRSPLTFLLNQPSSPWVAFVRKNELG